MSEEMSREDVITDKMASVMAKRLTELRKSKGYTAKLVAEKTSISLNTINAYEAANSKSQNKKKGKIKGMGIDNLIRFSKLYDVSADYLLGLSDVSNADIEYQAIYKRFGISEKSLSILEETAQRVSEVSKTNITIPFINLFLENDYFYQFCASCFDHGIKIKLLNDKLDLLHNKMREDSEFDIELQVVIDLMNDNINVHRYTCSQEAEVLINTFLENIEIEDFFSENIFEMASNAMSTISYVKKHIKKSKLNRWLDENIFKNEDDLSNDDVYLFGEIIKDFDAYIDIVRKDCFPNPISNAILEVYQKIQSYDGEMYDELLHNFWSILVNIAYERKTDVCGCIGELIDVFSKTGDLYYIGQLSVILKCSNEETSISMVKEHFQDFFSTNGYKSPSNPKEFIYYNYSNTT